MIFLIVMYYSVKFLISDKAYSVMKKVPYDVIQKKNSSQKSFLKFFRNFSENFFPVLNDVIRNFLHDNIGFILISLGINMIVILSASVA